MKNISIKEWAEEDRPREKMLLKGSIALSDSELLAIIIGTGTTQESAIDLAQKLLLNAHNNLNELGKFSVDDFSQVKGIGTAKAVTLAAAFELGRRRNLSIAKENHSIHGSKEIFAIMQPHIGDIMHEEFWALYLNNKNMVIAEKRISSGGVTHTVVDAKIILKHAISLYATGIILCHNHPSGSAKPSPEDIELTKKLEQSVRLIDCRLLDHIIITSASYFSFLDEGILI